MVAPQNDDRLPGLVFVVGAREYDALWAVFVCWTFKDCIEARAELESAGMVTRFVIFSRDELLERVGGRELLTECWRRIGIASHVHMHWDYARALTRVFGPRMLAILVRAVQS